MDNLKLLIDFGSTYTKVTAVDMEAEKVAATARAPSTVDSDITIGLEQALLEIAGKVDIGNPEKRDALACSSAAGGLRMVCIGYVPDLTSKAANHAALGAGAKVIRCYSYKLTRKEIAEIESLAPDIILLSGGTDGGDEQTIIHNARMLSGSNHAVSNIIVAGNKTAYDEIESIFRDAGKQVLFTRNVMPEIGVLDVEHCNREIRDIFLRNIVKARGIDKAQSIISGVIMPTPAAVLEAAKLLANGSDGAGGLGELMVIDPGGATTDVHSIAGGAPAAGGVIMANTLPEPYVKRTVEGNLGLKHNIDTLKELVKDTEIPPDFDAIVSRFNQGKLPASEAEIACHLSLSRLAVEVAVTQHVGRIDIVYGPTGEVMVQHGKDLTQIKTIIGTGGPIIDSGNPRHVLEGALFRQDKPMILKPKEPVFYLDENYILYAVGLLCQAAPGKALNIAKKYLKRV